MRVKCSVQVMYNPEFQSRIHPNCAFPRDEKDKKKSRRKKPETRVGRYSNEILFR